MEENVLKTDFDGIDNKASWDLISTRPLQKSSNSLYSNDIIIFQLCVYFFFSWVHCIHNSAAQCAAQ